MPDMFMGPAARAATTYDVYPTPHPIPVCLADSNSEPPATKLSTALDVLGHHLWSTMMETAWWSDAMPWRCIWASCASAAFLKGQGIQAEVCSAYAHIFATDAAMRVQLPFVVIGHPKDGRLKTGVHNVVVIHDGGRRWLLETALWQGHRPQFGLLPSMILIELPDKPTLSPLPDRLRESFENQMDVNVFERRPLGCAVGIGWRLMPRRRNWVSAPDARPKRAKAVASKLAAIQRAA